MIADRGSDPTCPPKNGKAPILDLPIEVQQAICSLLLRELRPNGRPTFIRSISGPPHSIEKERDLRSILLTCKTFYMFAHKGAYQHIDRHFKLFEQHLTDHKAQNHPDTSLSVRVSAEEFLKSMPPAIAKNLRFVTGNWADIYSLLKLLDYKLFNAHSITPSQLRLATWTDWYAAPYPVTSMLWHHQAWTFWRCYIIWESYRSLHDFDILLFDRGTPADPSVRHVMECNDDGHQMCRTQLLKRLTLDHFPAWIKERVKDDQVAFEWHHEENPKRTAFRRSDHSPFAGKRKSEGMLRAWEASLNEVLFDDAHT